MRYKTKVIWEYDYRLNKNNILTELINEQEDKDTDNK